MILGHGGNGSSPSGGRKLSLRVLAPLFVLALAGLLLLAALVGAIAIARRRPAPAGSEGEE